MSHKRQRQRQKRRLPGPLKLPKSYKPKYLSPIDEEILAQRLSRVPERWKEGYKDELRMSQMFVAKKVSKREVDQIVARLSSTKKQDEAPAEEEDIFIFKEETEEKDEERKLDPEEVERLVERLSQTSVRSETKSVDKKEQRRARSSLTASEMESLTNRLSKPRLYIDTDKQKRKAEGRFAGRKMTGDEIKDAIQRLAYKGMKKEQRIENREERNTKGYFAAWTPCDADFRQWSRMNSEVLNQNDRYYTYY